MKLLKNIFPKTELMIISTLLRKSKTEILNQSTDEVRTLLNDELNETLDGSPTTPQLVDGKELEILIMATIVTLKRKIQKM